jgi:hypothetical protein
MRGIKIGKHAVPSWLIVVILISGIGGTLGYYVWKTLTVQVEVKEPIEVLQYPSSLSLYPGETKEFNVTVDNHASINYSVVLDFQLGNTTYQDIYTTFSNEIYAVVSGQQNLTARIQVGADAPAMNTTLTINLARGVFPSGLVGYWRFDEGKGGIASDSSGNDNNGILVNGPAWVNGKYGKALSFDGVNDYVVVPQSSSLDIVNSVSVTAWIYPKALPASGVILSRWYDGTEPDRGIVLQLLPGFYHFGVIDDNNRLLVPFSFEINKWYFLAATWNGSVSRAYVNGIEIGNRSTSGSFTNQNLNLGIGSDINPFEWYFNGTIDNVMVYNRTLSPQEVMAEYTGSMP